MIARVRVDAGRLATPCGLRAFGMETAEPPQTGHSQPIEGAVVCAAAKSCDARLTMFLERAIHRGSNVTQRLRIINMRTRRPALRLDLRRDTSLVAWTPLAKGGAELPEVRRIQRAISSQISIGERSTFRSRRMCHDRRLDVVLGGNTHRAIRCLRRCRFASWEMESFASGVFAVSHVTKKSLANPGRSVGNC